jgi:2-furoyl-CoA dehydrogenase FAD binding subunit
LKPSSFDYSKPDTVDEALDLLNTEKSNSRILAGGQSLAAMLNMRLVQPTVLIDISDLNELKTIAVQNQTIQVGAAVTQSELLAWDQLHQQPLLEKVLPWVGHYQTRQRGTICGSIAHSDPSSELPLALAVLGGSILAQSKNGSRTIKTSEFQIGPMQTSLKDNEMITCGAHSYCCNR